MVAEPNSDLALIDTARKALAEARDLGDVRDVRDRAIAIQRYLSRREGAEEAAKYANEIRLRAERRIGELLAEQGEMRGGAKSNRSTLPDGVSRDDSSKFQRIATLPDDVFESALQEPEPTTAGLLRLVKLANQPVAQPQESGSCTASDLAALAASGRRFGTIYADPPWSYGNQATRASTDNHYRTMSLDDIKALPVRDVAADAAHLHLWTTNGFLREAFDVLEAWGFTYKSCFVWVKPQMGIGNYWRVSHEFMLFGMRGDAGTFRDRGLISWLSANRSAHSAKPEGVRGLIERASPGPYLELFGRTTAAGWTTWGDQIERSLLAGEPRVL